MRAKLSLPLLALLLATIARGPAGAQSPCTSETLQVRGTPVTIGYCVTGPARSTPGAEVMIPVTATYSSPHGSFERRGEYRFISGESASRIVQNLNLDRLGLVGSTLHLTLLYTGGVVRIEGALLTPGAITVK